MSRTARGSKASPKTPLFLSSAEGSWENSKNTLMLSSAQGSWPCTNTLRCLLRPKYPAQTRNKNWCSVGSKILSMHESQTVILFGPGGPGILSKSKKIFDPEFGKRSWASTKHPIRHKHLEHTQKKHWFLIQHKRPRDFEQAKKLSHAQFVLKIL